MKTTINQTLATAAIASLLALGASGTALAAADKDKCYGISKAGQNDCGGKHVKHSCAGQSKADNDGNDWKYVEKGSCEKMGGKMQPAAEMKTMKEEKKY